MNSVLLCIWNGYESTVELPGNSSEYYVNGEHVTLANYKKDLESIGVVTKARNCLVFQVSRNLISQVIDLTTTISLLMYNNKDSRWKISLNGGLWSTTSRLKTLHLEKTEPDILKNLSPSTRAVRYGKKWISRSVLFSSGKTKTKMTSSDPFFPWRKWD
jgi:hypothetical protein